MSAAHFPLSHRVKGAENMKRAHTHHPDHEVETLAVGTVFICRKFYEYGVRYVSGNGVYNCVVRACLASDDTHI